MTTSNTHNLSDCRSGNVLVVGGTGPLGSALVRHLEEAQGKTVYLTGRRKNWHPNWSSRAKYTALSFETPQDVAHQLGDAGLLQRHFESLVVFPPRLPRSSESLPLAHVWIDALTEAFVGPMELIRLITPRLRRGRGDLARLVLISGITSVQVMGKYAQNSAIRCAWLGAAKAAAVALGPEGVTVNTLSLAGVMTDQYVEVLRARAQNSGREYEEQYAHEVSNVPLRRYASVEDVVAVICSLLGTAGTSMTGQNLILDGGFVPAY